MNIPLASSLLFLFAAFFWSIRIARRERDWRFGLLAAAMGFIAIRRTLLVVFGTPFIFGPGAFAEIPGLILGVVTLAAIVALDRAMLEQRRAERQLKKSHRQLRGLAARLNTIREEERAAISREIHEEIAQVLTGLKIEAKLFGNAIQNTHPHLLERTKSMQDLVDRTMLTMRDMATELRPGILDTLGLLAAIEWQVETVQNRSGIRFHLNFDVGNEKFDAKWEITVFRIFQESLNNVLRHAEATTVDIGLGRENGNLMLTVRDNGKGISTEALNNPDSLGILGMRERALQFDGQVSIAPASDNGTIVSLSIPFVYARESAI